MIKPAHSSIVRNLFAPRSDRLQVLYTITDGAGAILPNLARDRAPCSLGAAEIREVHFGTEALARPATVERLWTGFFPPDGPHLAFEDPAARSAFVQVHRRRGPPVNFARGTILLRFLMDDSRGDVRPLLTAGVSSGIAGTRGTLEAQRLGGLESDQIEVCLTDFDGRRTTLRLSGITSRLSHHTLVISWGERGLAAVLDRQPQFSSVAECTGGWRLDDGDTIRLLADAGSPDVLFMPPTRFGSCGLAGFAMWDVQLTLREVQELLIDPHLLMRPHAGPMFLFKNNPVMTRPTRNDSARDRSGMTFNCVTSEQSHGHAYYRIHYRPVHQQGEFKVSRVGHAENGREPGMIYRPVPIIINDLEDDTLYEWYADWSEDGLEYQPFPGGAGTFRTAPGKQGSFSFAFVTDDHWAKQCAVDDPFGIESRSFEALANWRTNKDIYESPRLDFVVDGGDHLFTDTDAAPGGLDRIDDGRISDLDGAKFERIASWVAQQNLRLKSAPYFLVLGNHEGEYGYLQSSKADRLIALQKQCTISRKRCVPNPDHETYAGQYGIPMGEHEPDPTDAGNDWIPALSDRDVAGTRYEEWMPGRSYRDDFIRDRLGPGGGWAENRSPLQNYYAWRWGPLLCVVLDVGRYSNPGERAENALAEGTIGACANGIGGRLHRPDRPWRFGPVQKEFLISVLSAATDVRWKLIFLHHLPGGERIGATARTPAGRNYGRGSGIRMPTGADGQGEDQEWLVRVCQRFGVAAILKGHDHRFSVVRNGVNLVTGPRAADHHRTPERSGWNWTGLETTYGTAQSLGSLGPDGRPMPERLVATFNVIGYLRVDVTPRQLRITLRQTSVSLADDLRTPRQLERWAGPIYLPRGGVVDLARPADLQQRDGVPDYEALPAGVPADVVWAERVDALDESDAWWEQTAPGLYTRQAGDEPADEPYAGTLVKLDDAVEDPVVVTSVPRDVVSYDLRPLTTIWTTDLDLAP